MLRLGPANEIRSNEMLVTNGTVQFEDNEKQLWEKLLERKLDAITPQLLRELGEARVTELTDEGNFVCARMAAEHVRDIPKVLH